jgi:hypothetical protein
MDDVMLEGLRVRFVAGLLERFRFMEVGNLLSD